MRIADNIKNIREEKNIEQIEVATHIGMEKSVYSKIEKRCQGYCGIRTARNGSTL